MRPAPSSDLRGYLAQLEESHVLEIDGRKIIDNEEIAAVYEANDYQPLWNDKTNRDDLIEILTASYYEGLFPGDYHAELIVEYNSQLSNFKTDEDFVAKADIVMTDALLTYAHHMIQGKVSPTGVDPNWNYALRDIPDNVELRVLDRLRNNTLKEGNDNIVPQMPQYARLKSWFAYYDSLERSGEEHEQISYPGAALRKGDSSAVISELKMILSTHDRAIDADVSGLFDEDFEEVVMEFQRLNGLDDDGIIGKATFEVLNISNREKMDMIRVNMERCRWVSNELPERFLLVNIADFNLYLFQDMELEYSCRVVIGKEHHETPVFHSDIQYVVFNPTWTVPYSIASKEMLPRLKTDPNYLQDRNMTLLSGNTEVDPTTVDFSKYSINNFPYVIRQEPGPRNALGRMKFIFPNKYSVYLHDTPSKSFFQQTKRAFSHGCVRVQNPSLLAENLLSDKGYDQDRIQEVLDTKETKTVFLKDPLPVYLMYWTCYENRRDDKLYFFRDLYGRDQRILNKLYETW